MFFIGNLFNLRQSETPGEEKPFLEHLEDLRTMLIRVVVTLAIGFFACFFFRNDLMEIMRSPIDGVWQLQLNTALQDLPVKVNAATWERATKAANDGNALTAEQREALYGALSQGDEDFRFHVEAVIYYRAALAIEGKKAQQEFLENLPGVGEQMREQLLALSHNYHVSKGLGPDPDADSRRRLVFMQSLNPTEGFMLSFKLAFFAAIALTFPFLLYFILQFILPGLHKKEKKVLFPALFIGFGLFLTGVLFAYFLVLPRVLEFFSTYSGQMGISNDWRIGEYISFATQFVLIFGVAFELPVVVMALVMLDILSYTTMAKSRAYAIVGILITAAIITPTPDAMTLGLLAGPMYILYEICIVLAWFVERKRKKKEAAEILAEKERVAKILEEIKKEEGIGDEHFKKIMSEESSKPKASGGSCAPVIASPAGLLQHEDDNPLNHPMDDDLDLEDHLAAYDYDEDHDFDDEHHDFDNEEHLAAHEEMVDDEGKVLDLNELDESADLEGNGEALDPEAEAREAGDPDDDDMPEQKS